ncbi:MAG: hypothetical protein V1702_05560 [Candidatus Woesearchaeota archaeon]
MNAAQILAVAKLHVMRVVRRRVLIPARLLIAAPSSVVLIVVLVLLLIRVSLIRVVLRVLALLTVRDFVASMLAVTIVVLARVRVGRAARMNVAQILAVAELHVMRVVRRLHHRHRLRLVFRLIPASQQIAAAMMGAVCLVTPVVHLLRVFHIVVSLLIAAPIRTAAGARCIVNVRHHVLRIVVLVIVVHMIIAVMLVTMGVSELIS